MKKINYYLFIFLLGSFGGWCAEFIWRGIYFGKIVNPGAMIGPFCPIYGTTGVLLFFILKRKNKPILNFGITVFLCLIIEYIVAVVSEKVYGNKLWNYSKHPFNFQGRVCLDMTLLFSISALLIFYFLKPCIDQFYFKHLKIVNIYNIIFGTLFILNIILQYVLKVI